MGSCYKHKYFFISILKQLKDCYRFKSLNKWASQLSCMYWKLLNAEAQLHMMSFETSVLESHICSYSRAPLYYGEWFHLPKIGIQLKYWFAFIIFPYHLSVWIEPSSRVLVSWCYPPYLAIISPISRKAKLMLMITCTQTKGCLRSWTELHVPHIVPWKWCNAIAKPKNHLIKNYPLDLEVSKPEQHGSSFLLW